MKIKSFEDLEIYQLSIVLAKEIYVLTNKLPKEEKFIIKDQLIRAVTSIGANIAEGFGRDTTKDFIRFLYNARGSLMEVKHFLNLSVELGYFKSDEIKAIENQCDILGIKINNLIKALKRR
jgi:four helix bundle protein